MFELILFILVIDISLQMRGKSIAFPPCQCPCGSSHVLWVFLSFFLENEVISLFIPHRSMPNHFELSAANLEKITEISKF
jgi:hypothetical protein